MWLLETESVYGCNHLVKICKSYIISRSFVIDINILETIKPLIYVSGFRISRSNFDAKWYALAIKVVFTLLSEEPRHPKLQEYEMR